MGIRPMTDNAQFNLNLGITGKDEGKAKVEANNASFVETMREYAREYAANGCAVSTDVVRLYANRIGIKPEHPNAWGSIFKTDEFVPIGWKPSRFATNHARSIRVWKLRKARDEKSRL